MSSVIAMIQRNEICLASDMKCVDSDTGHETDPVVKQITLNNSIAIGFTGSFGMARIIIDTLSNQKNSNIVSQLALAEIPSVLDDIYNSYISGKSFSDGDVIDVSALVIGIDNKPEIIKWVSTGFTDTLRQSHPNNFTASVLSPADLDDDICSRVLWESAKRNSDAVSLSLTAVNYFKIVSSLSQFVSDEAVIWTRHISQV